MLLGPNKSYRDPVKPLAHAALADLVAQERDNMSVSQTARIVHLFAKNIHDTEVGARTCL